MSDIIRGEPSNYAGIKQLTNYLECHNGYVAGGVFKNIFLGEPIKDIDIFFRTEADFNEAVSLMGEPDFQNDRVHVYDVDGVRVEYIKHIFGEPAEVLKRFDFTISKFAYGFDLIKPETKTSSAFDDIFGLLEYNGSEEIPFVFFHEQFFEHLALRRLVIESELEWPISTFERVLRYTTYGFKICRGSKIALLESIINFGATGGVDNLARELSESLYAGVD